MNMTQLFKPYEERITLPQLVIWLRGEADKKKIPHEAAEVALSQTFLEIDAGKQFPKNGCQCGCGLTNPHSSLAHYMREVMVNVHGDATAEYIKIVEKKLNKALNRRLSIFLKVGLILDKLLRYLA